jgi:hypothetical protein
MDVPKPMHRLESGLVQHVPQRFLIHGNHPTAEARSLSRICSLEISRRFPRYVLYAPAAIELASKWFLERKHVSLVFHGGLTAGHFARRTR